MIGMLELRTNTTLPTEFKDEATGDEHSPCQQADEERHYQFDRQSKGNHTRAKVAEGKPEKNEEREDHTREILQPMVEPSVEGLGDAAQAPLTRLIRSHEHFSSPELFDCLGYSVLQHLEGEQAQRCCEHARAEPDVSRNAQWRNAQRSGA